MIEVTSAQQTGAWKAGLCGCCSDCGLLCQAYYWGSCLEAESFADSRGDECACCHWVEVVDGVGSVPFWTRVNIDLARGIEPQQCYHVAVICMCGTCTAVQSAREIRFLLAERKASAPTVVVVQGVVQGYGQPGYGAPPPGYGQPPPGYGQPEPAEGPPPGNQFAVIEKR
jgi:Cys-rich protein (TIGR01571 family)